ncbi:hypothetical protein DH2020_013407 [Rehmannia glutinosa]|uniref:Defective in cullin neddylation protein n=1 Tax=Rehmannia glutinosa TaxID=99300 RepID=A0ABR0X3C4_REHGL
MPRTSSRKGTTNSTASGNSSTVDLFRAASGKAASKELERIDQLFYSYASNSSGMIEGCFRLIKPFCSLEFGFHVAITQSFMAIKCMVLAIYISAITELVNSCFFSIMSSHFYICLSHVPDICLGVSNLESFVSSPEGIESLCSDLEVDHTDVRVLMLAWKMQAEKQGYFTLDEWRSGLKGLRADTILKLKKALLDLEKEVRRPSNFADFYSYAFRYCLTEEKQKSIDIESICLLLDLVLGSHFRPQIDALIQYLKIQIDYKVINIDQWMGFYRFCNEISFPDLSNYDPDLAWPLILDNFVDWLRSKRG